MNIYVAFDPKNTMAVLAEAPDKKTMLCRAQVHSKMMITDDEVRSMASPLIWLLSEDWLAFVRGLSSVLRADESH